MVRRKTNIQTTENNCKPKKLNLLLLFTSLRKHKSLKVIREKFLFECLFLRQTFLQSIQCQSCHGCINHDPVRGLCSELFEVILLHQSSIHKTFSTLAGIEPGISRSLTVRLNHVTKALTLCMRCFVNSVPDVVDWNSVFSRNRRLYYKR